MTEQKNTATTDNNDGLNGTTFFQNGDSTTYKNGLLVKSITTINNVIETINYTYANDTAPTVLIEKNINYRYL